MTVQYSYYLIKVYYDVIAFWLVLITFGVISRPAFVCGVYAGNSSAFQWPLTIRVIAAELNCNKSSARGSTLIINIVGSVIDVNSRQAELMDGGVMSSRRFGLVLLFLSITACH